MSSIKDKIKKVAQKKSGRLALYIALITMATPVIEGSFRLAEIYLTRDDLHQVAREPDLPREIEEYPNEPPEDIEDVKNEFQNENQEINNEIPPHPHHGVILSWRVFYIIMGLLVILATLEIRRLIKKSKGGSDAAL